MRQHLRFSKQTHTKKMLPVQDFLQSIKNVPLVCIDLLVIDSENRILLGKRKNQPAQNYFFAPGGRIRKCETQRQAIERISKDEIGVVVPYDRWKLLGVFDHIYDANFFNARHADTNEPVWTHCVPLAYVLHLGPDSALNEVFTSGMMEQHSEIRWQPLDEISRQNDVHSYTKDYAISMN